MGENTTVGRPCIYPKPMKQFAVDLTPGHVELAKLIGNGNISSGIRKALDIVGSDTSLWSRYIKNMSEFDTSKYISEKTTIRITLSDGLIKLAREETGSANEGIRRALEVYYDGASGCIYSEKLDKIRRGLYGQNGN